jgi:hypothetical protein
VALLKTLFNADMYRAALLEYDIDTQQMPLGKLSARHVADGFRVLSEIQALLEAQAAADQSDDDTAAQRRKAAMVGGAIHQEPHI